MHRGRHEVAVLAALLLAAPACRRAHDPEPPARIAPPVTRLGGALDGPVFWLLAPEQKPSVLLGPAEEREVPVSIPDDSRLRFSLATLKGAPPRGELALEVRADGRPLETIRIPTARSREWRPVSIPLGQPAPHTLGFHLHRTDARGNLVPKQRDAGAAHWVAIGSPRVAAPVAPEKRKVLIWISVDTLRADHLGAWGYARETSPAIDRFAREAVVFEDAFSAASWTLPSLTSQFTSRYPSEHGGRTEEQRRDPGQRSIFEVLAEQGFSVLGVTANHFVAPQFGNADGFDTLWETSGDAGEVTRLALRALDEWDGGHLALFVHYMDPHAYYEPPPPFETLFTAPYRGPINGRNFEGLKKADAPALARVIGLYDGEIAFADLKIGELLAALGSRNLLRRAVVAFSADHGEEFQEHGGWTHKRTVYQELLHVPLAVRLPGIGGRRVAQPVSSIDLAPTLLDALGIAAPASFRGVSLLPLARGVPLAERGLIAETERGADGNHRLALRRGRLKYLLTTSRGGSPAPPILREELYDLASDPRETRSLNDAAELPALRRELVAYLVAARARTRVIATKLSPEERERLRALGYLQ
jgi:arylsulfatase A-like enzyme